MKICLVEPFHTGSHAAWAEEFARFSRHEVELLTLSGRHWKWRMHGGAVTLARHFLASQCKPDLLLASDMLDLTTFLALTREQSAGIPTALYFHENQLSYPWSPNGANPAQQRAHYAFINYTSALAADAVIFNSHYHRDVFLEQLPDFLKGFPDLNELETFVQQHAAKPFFFTDSDPGSGCRCADDDVPDSLPLVENCLYSYFPQSPLGGHRARLHGLGGHPAGHDDHHHRGHQCRHRR